MYLTMIRIYPDHQHQHAVIDILDSLTGPISANADCLICSISTETDETGVICYQERWRTREALQCHLRSALFDRILAAMELSRQPPDVMFYGVKETIGLDLVEQSRVAH